MFLLFHPESPVKVEKLLELIRKQRAVFVSRPTGVYRLRRETWNGEPLMDEVTELLASIQDLPAVENFPRGIVARVK